MADAIFGRNLADTFHQRVRAQPSRTALLRKVKGSWKGMTWLEFHEQVFELATALQNKGIQRGDRVSILCQTRPEWTIIDLAILSIGAVTVPIYPSVTADDVHFILKQSGSKMVFLEDKSQQNKFLSVKSQLPELQHAVALSKPIDEAILAYGEIKKEAIESIKDRSKALESWEMLSKTFDQDSLATVVYTSGTTGLPKGARLHHSNFLSMAESTLRVIPLKDSDCFLGFLPLAHVLGRVEQFLFICVGWTHAYAESLARVADNMFQVKPTVMVSVPRIYEKFYTKIAGQFENASKIKKLLFKEALRTGVEYSRSLQNSKKPGPILAARYRLMDKLLYSKIRERFGGRLRFTVSGGAPLARDIAEFFHACGILILEGYGLTETTGPICCNTPKHYSFGTVGKVQPGVNLKIQEDGEIWIKGPQVFHDYYSQEGVDGVSLKNGWFATGDIGELTDRGFLKITDRKKDLIVTAGGKNIPPQKIENLLKKDPLFSQIMVVGNKRKFISALITVDPTEAKRFIGDTADTSASDSVNVIKDKGFLNEVKVRLELLNQRLPSYEKIKKFEVLAREFSVEAGELTPSLKVKRRFCEKKYEKLIDAMYTVS